MAGGTLKAAEGGGGRRGRRRRGRHPAALSEINITPFVDVVLVLLIVFMVAAPLLTVGVPIQLPKTAATAQPTEKEAPLTITLAPDGKTVLQKTEIDEADLIPKLQAVAAERTDRKIYLRADGSITYSRVAQIMGALNAAGFRNIGLVTDPDGPRMTGSGG